MRRRGGAAALSGAVLGLTVVVATVLVALAATTGPLVTAHPHPGVLPRLHGASGTGTAPPRVTVSPVPTPTARASTTPHVAGPAHESRAVVIVLLLVVIAFLVAAAVAGAALLRPRRPSSRLPVGAGSAPPETLRRAAVSARSALDDADPRAAVIRCWLVLEDAAVASGYGHADTETSGELAARLADRVDAEAIGTLRGLFHRARFSAARITEADRSSARLAADRIVADLSEAPVPQGIR